MVRKLFLGLVVFALTACAVSPGNPVVLPTPIPTFTQALLTPTNPNFTQANALDSKQSGDLSVTIYCNNNPPIQGANIFEVFVVDTNSQPITDAKISYDIDMTNMSHGKYVVEATSIGEGYYTGKVAFLMPGPWRVLVAIDRSGQTSTIRFDFKVNSK